MQVGNNRARLCLSETNLGVAFRLVRGRNGGRALTEDWFKQEVARPDLVAIKAKEEVALC